MQALTGPKKRRPRDAHPSSQPRASWYTSQEMDRDCHLVLAPDRRVFAHRPPRHSLWLRLAGDGGAGIPHVLASGVAARWHPGTRLSRVTARQSNSFAADLGQRIRSDLRRTLAAAGPGDRGRHCRCPARAPGQTDARPCSHPRPRSDGSGGVQRVFERPCQRLRSDLLRRAMGTLAAPRRPCPGPDRAAAG